MVDRLRSGILRALRIPEAPSAPAGAPGSLRTFRAGRRFYQLRLLSWAVAQMAALAGIVISLFVLQYAREEADRLRTQPPTPPPAEVAPAVAEPPAKKSRAVKPKRQSADAVLRQLAQKVPPWSFPVLAIIEAVVLMGFLASLPVSYALVRLDYEMRWYLVTDRSLRIREGIWTLRESTMSFANLQQVVVSQGPIQRLLKLADVRVQSAGGGGDESAPDRDGASLHVAVFHGVENATEIRDLILERLRLYRESGLGDPDDPSQPTVPSGTSARDAVLALLGEVRSLRAAWSTGRSQPSA